MRYGWMPNDQFIPVRQHGFNRAISTGNEILASVGGTALDMFSPTAGAATTITSGSTNDDVGQSGLQYAKVYGILGPNFGFQMVEETAAMNGTGVVALTESFYRINKIRPVKGFGGAVNAGVVAVKHGSTVLMEIPIGYGRSQSVFYTIPGKTAGVQNARPIPGAYIRGFGGCIEGATTAENAIFRLWTREYGGIWEMVDSKSAVADGKSDFTEIYPTAEWFPAGTDLYVDCVVVGTNVEVSGDLYLNLRVQ